jgi:hypothetical protein
MWEDSVDRRLALGVRLEESHASPWAGMEGRVFGKFGVAEPPEGSKFGTLMGGPGARCGVGLWFGVELGVWLWLGWP